MRTSTTVEFAEYFPGDLSRTTRAPKRDHFNLRLRDLPFQVDPAASPRLSLAIPASLFLLFRFSHGKIVLTPKSKKTYAK
jgi:hypothetical protein